MRSIKFRAWDDENKIYTNYQILDGLIMFLDKFTGAWLNNKNDRFKFMQYTGTNDRYDTEIYEWDIVRLNGEDDCFIVEWDSDTAMYILNAINEGWITDFDSFRGKEIEVVGNIYENPELLEVEG